MKVVKRITAAVLLSVFITCGVQAAPAISLGSPVDGTLSAAKGTMDEYTLHLASAADVGFNITVSSNGGRGPYSAECYIGIFNAGKSVGFGYHLDQLGEPEMRYRTELMYKKTPERLPAGDYTVSVSAPHYLFSATAEDEEFVANDFAVYYTLELTGIPSQPATSGSGGIKVLYNGSYIGFDQPPVIQNGRTLVPLRAIFEAMNASVEWDEATKTVTAKRANITVKLKVGSAQLYVNGKSVTLDVPAQIIGGRTMVPARAVAESFGANVDWDSIRQTVVIIE